MTLQAEDYPAPLRHTMSEPARLTSRVAVFDAVGVFDALQPEPRSEECRTAWGRLTTEGLSEMQHTGFDHPSTQEQMPVQHVPAGRPLFFAFVLVPYTADVLHHNVYDCHEGEPAQSSER